MLLSRNELVSVFCMLDQYSVSMHFALHPGCKKTKQKKMHTLNRGFKAGLQKPLGDLPMATLTYGQIA